MKKRFKTREDRILTLANAISISRIVMCIPLIYYLENSNIIFSFGIILLIIISDLLDGFVARKANEITNFGKLIDPLADKICILVVIIFLIFKYGFWFLLFLGLLTIRDVIIIIIGVYLVNIQKDVFQSNWTGKWFIFISSLMMICFLYSAPQILRVILYIASILLMVISTLQYIMRYRYYLNNIKEVDNYLV